MQLVVFVLVCLCGCSRGPVNTRFDDIYSAIGAGDVIDMEKHLDNGTPIETNSAANVTPLMSAVTNGCCACVEELLSRGARHDIAYEGWPLICFAVNLAKGDTCVVSELLGNGVALEPWPDSIGIGQFAISNGDTALLRFLLDHDALLDNPSWSAGSLLCSAALLGQYECAKIVLRSGADVNRRTEIGTPLHHAAASGRLDLCQLLLQNGADQFSLGIDGRSPSEVARYLHHDSLADYLARPAQ